MKTERAQTNDGAVMLGLNGVLLEYSALVVLILRRGITSQ